MCLAQSSDTHSLRAMEPLLPLDEHTQGIGVLGKPVATRATPSGVGSLGLLSHAQENKKPWTRNGQSKHKVTLGK